MNIGIIGCGAVGSTVTELCGKLNKVDEITISDINNDAIKDTIKKIKQARVKKIKTVKINSKEKRPFERPIKGCNVVLNATFPKLNTYIAKECIKQNANYIDLASEVIKYPNVPKSSLIYELRKLDTKFKKEKLVGITNAGMSPGISDLLASTIFKEIEPKLIKKVSIMLADIIVSKEMITSWSPEILMLEALSTPTIWKNKKIIEEEYKPEKYKFSKPIGEKKVYTLSGHPEIITIPESTHIEIEELSVKAAFETKNLNLEEMTFQTLKKISKKPIRNTSVLEMLSKEFVHPNKFEELVKKKIIKEEYGAVEVNVKYLNKQNKIKDYGLGVSSSLKKVRKIVPFATTASFGAAILPAILIKLMCKKEITKPGIWTCSQIEKKEMILKNLKKWGVRPKRIN